MKSDYVDAMRYISTPAFWERNLPAAHLLSRLVLALALTLRPENSWSSQLSPSGEPKVEDPQSTTQSKSNRDQKRKRQPATNQTYEMF